MELEYHNNLEGIFNNEEWENLCDQCGICCFYKIEDADTHEILISHVQCPFLISTSGICQNYTNRFKLMKTCIKISPESLYKTHLWLPRHCAYRCIYEGRHLPEWHKLFSIKNNNNDSSLIQKIDKLTVLPAYSRMMNWREIIKFRKNSILPDSKYSLDDQIIKNIVDDNRII